MVIVIDGWRIQLLTCGREVKDLALARIRVFICTAAVLLEPEPGVIPQRDAAWQLGKADVGSTWEWCEIHSLQRGGLLYFFF